MHFGAVPHYCHNCIIFTHIQRACILDEVESAIMKVTVTFGQTGVVVPCKEGWTVRDLIQQATQRYRKLLEQVRFIEMHLLFLPLTISLSDDNHHYLHLFLPLLLN